MCVGSHGYDRLNGGKEESGGWSAYGTKPRGVGVCRSGARALPKCDVIH